MNTEAHEIVIIQVEAHAEEIIRVQAHVTEAMETEETADVTADQDMTES